MHVCGVLGHYLVSILIDTGNTHNFADHVVIKKAGILIEHDKPFQVMVANGDRLKSECCCSQPPLEIIIHTDFYLLPLGGCDLVLGTQWLHTLGLAYWDFA